MKIGDIFQKNKTIVYAVTAIGTLILLGIVGTAITASLGVITKILLMLMASTFVYIVVGIGVEKRPYKQMIIPLVIAILLFVIAGSLNPVLQAFGLEGFSVFAAP